MSILSLLAGFKQFQAVLLDFMLIFVQFGEILGEVVETFRDLSSQTPVGRRRRPEGVWEDKSRKVSTATSPKFRRTAGKNRKARPRKKVTHFFILFFKNALLSLICRLYENEPDPSIYISKNRGQTLHIFCKIRKKWEFSRQIIYLWIFYVTRVS